MRGTSSSLFESDVRLGKLMDRTVPSRFTRTIDSPRCPRRPVRGRDSLRYASRKQLGRATTAMREIFIATTSGGRDALRRIRRRVAATPMRQRSAPGARPGATFSRLRLSARAAQGCPSPRTRSNRCTRASAAPTATAATSPTERAASRGSAPGRRQRHNSAQLLQRTRLKGCAGANCTRVAIQFPGNHRTNRCVRGWPLDQVAASIACSFVNRKEPGTLHCALGPHRETIRSTWSSA
jgi:hypothetical protein